MTITGRLPVFPRDCAKMRSRFGVRLAEMQPEKSIVLPAAVRIISRLKVRDLRVVRSEWPLGVKRLNISLAKMMVDARQTVGGSQRRFIRLATNPAPKPLPILTTVTFDAQEFNIPSNAATPPNEAP